MNTPQRPIFTYFGHATVTDELSGGEVVLINTFGEIS